MLKIEPNKLKGTVMIPPSKSISHRAIICASLAKGVSVLSNIGDSEDITATIAAMTSFGTKIERSGSRLTIDGTNTLQNIGHQMIDCNESGSTLRFLVPLALQCNKITFTGSKRLGQRPLDTYYSLFQESGITYEKGAEGFPLTIYGGSLSGCISLCGNISSQFITGLLFVLPLCHGNYEIKITTPLESKAYVDLTIDVLNTFGIRIQNQNYETFLIQGGQTYRPANLFCEGDFSQAAFYLVAGTLGSEIRCKGLQKESKQGDKAILSVIEAMGGKIVYEEDSISALASQTEGITIDASQIPDLVPILAVLGALSKGRTEIINAQRLRIKESDRLAAITEQLTRLGARIVQKPDGLVIDGVSSLHGGETDGCNDHRIAMSMAIAATRAAGEVLLRDYACVKKSYPGFWEDYQALGGRIDDWE